MQTATVTMKLKEPKKHSVRYDAEEGAVDPALTSLYVSKLALPRGAPPETLTVTLAW